MDFHSLYQSYAPLVHRFALFLCGDGALADDITSETFVRAWTARGKIKEATVKAYLYDPTGEKAKAVKARYRGYCRTCGADTSPRNGKGDAYLYCRHCHRGAATRKRTRSRVRDAMRAWAELYGRAPSSFDWSRTHARRRGALGHQPDFSDVQALDHFQGLHDLLVLGRGVGLQDHR